MIYGMQEMHVRDFSGVSFVLTIILRDMCRFSTCFVSEVPDAHAFVVKSLMAAG